MDINRVTVNRNIKLEVHVVIMENGKPVSAHMTRAGAVEELKRRGGNLPTRTQAGFGTIKKLEVKD